ncbi:hypothetical protein [Candidatus Methanoperedens nitratireducens]|uniref:Uncharacterized protein n=1 Tax=Candidatus Methanoperedens nitratireducens TaxID=1392998 RepID=A0A284VQ31_9EURY|nr:hypothetical protein [Candidatus Methanoperedens nitroreducens]SNQ61303.1 hypothetical protein MNV_30036 [Candidatus Methanoperedens nitroreducens]
MLIGEWDFTDEEQTILSIQIIVEKKLYYESLIKRGSDIKCQEWKKEEQRTNSKGGRVAKPLWANDGTGGLSLDPEETGDCQVNGGDERCK